MRWKMIAVFLVFAVPAGFASADVLVLDSGKTMKVASYQVEGSALRVVLNDRAEMLIPVDWVKAIRIDPEPEPEPQQAATEAVAQPPSGLAYADLILASSKRNEMDWKLVAAIMRAESNFNPRAVSPKGAMGLMQLMPDTARLYRVDDPYDPAQNIEAGVRHMKTLLSRYQGNLNLALAAYNSGEKTVEKYNGVPPYAETRTYVQRVLQFLQGLSS